MAGTSPAMTGLFRREPLPMPSPKKPQVKRVVLAYSGGLDTSIILKWLQTEYGAEVITFTADLGQGEELEPARKKAELLGIKPEHIFIEDVREEFVRDYVFPMFRANAQYEGLYLLGTSIARPLIAKHLVEIAHKMGADAIAHGATGKGNDQVRFELSAYALEPDIKIIAPWREWEFASRNALLAFAEQHQIPIAKDKRGDAPFSTDANLLHVSSEGKVLEDPAEETPAYVYSRTVHPEDAPDKPTVVEIAFEKGDPVAIDGKAMSPATLLTALNKLGHDNGIGRLDLVENRFVGMKSRGMYETPGGTILLAAHRAIESITLDRGAAHLKDELMPKYAELIYNGFWFSPEREMLQVLIDKSQEMVAGRVRLKLYKGGVHVIGRDSSAFALRPGPRDFRGRRRRLRPPGRRRLHQAQRAAPADAGEAEEEGREGVKRTRACALTTLASSLQLEALRLGRGGDELHRLREGVLERLGGLSVGNLGKAGGDRLGRALALVEIDAGRLADMRDGKDAGARAKIDARGRVLAHEKQHARRHRFRRHELRGDRRQQALGHAGARRRREHVDADVVLRALKMQHVHEPDHGRLRGAVVRLAEIAVDAGRRGREHDAPIVALPHARPDGLRAIGRADQVHVEDELEIRHLHLGEGLVAQHAGVVDEDVDAPPHLFGARNHRGDLLEIGDVGGVRDRRPAAGANFFHDPHGVVEGSAVDRDH